VQRPRLRRGGGGSQRRLKMAGGRAGWRHAGWRNEAATAAANELALWLRNGGGQPALAQAAAVLSPVSRNAKS